MARIYKVVLLREAVADLKAIRLYIADKAGEKIADAYIARIEAFCRGFDKLPERGIPRDGIREGLRIAIFGGRISIAYRIASHQVVILRVLGQGRDIDTLLSNTE